MNIRLLLTAFYLLLSTSLYAATIPTAQTATKPQQIPPPTVLSIIPSQGEPGTKISIDGSAFGQNRKVFLGSQEIETVSGNDKQLEFIIPLNLKAGVYALYIQRNDGANSRPYNFTVIPLKPVVKSITPDQLPSCASGGDRDVTVSGQNFIGTSQLFFDGVVIPSRLKSSESITFATPQVGGGLHQVMVKNSPENGSVTLGLMISTKPEIDHITIGNEFVNYYELIVEGRNFQQNSAIMVDGMRIGGGGGGDDLAAREKLIYISCTKLIYQRHPYSPTNKEFRIQVVNNGGEGSQVVMVNAP